MTPMLILLFAVKPSTAISSDLVAAMVMRPFGAAVHLRKGTVNLRLVGWMVLGSVPPRSAGFSARYLSPPRPFGWLGSAPGGTETETSCPRLWTDRTTGLRGNQDPAWVTKNLSG
jgi:hypothetical protein